MHKEEKRRRRTSIYLSNVPSPAQAIVGDLTRTFSPHLDGIIEGKNEHINYIHGGANKIRYEGGLPIGGDDRVSNPRAAVDHGYD